MLIDKDVTTRPMAEQLLRVLGADPNDCHSRLYLEQVRPLEYDRALAALGRVRITALLGARLALQMERDWLSSFPS